LLDEVDPEILRTYEKLGIPLREQDILAGVERPEGSRRVAVDAAFDSVSVATTFQEELAKAGVLFMPISEALQKRPFEGQIPSGEPRVGLPGNIASKPAERQLAEEHETKQRRSYRAGRSLCPHHAKSRRTPGSAVRGSSLDRRHSSAQRAGAPRMWIFIILPI
jgi:hypothetical protein